MNLIRECPGAQEFLRAAAANIETKLLFPAERFSAVQAGILATSGIDLQNEMIAPECLEDMAAQINEHSMWLTREHNPLLGIIGRVLAAGRFYAPESQLQFVA